MKSIKNLAEYPTEQTLVSDDVIEFHAARIILLLLICGTSKKIDGLTKLAKLDFLVRYPDFFEQIAKHLKKEEQSCTTFVESSMVRHHYGPWDKRYYQVLSYLESRQIISIEKGPHNSFVFELTPLGDEVAKKVAKDSSFDLLCEQMKKVKKVVGSKGGSALKRLIYEVFEAEVKQKALGQVIKS